MKKREIVIGLCALVGSIHEGHFSSRKMEMKVLSDIKFSRVDFHSVLYSPLALLAVDVSLLLAGFIICQMFFFLAERKCTKETYEFCCL